LPRIARIVARSNSPRAIEMPEVKLRRADRLQQLGARRRLVLQLMIDAIRRFLEQLAHGRLVLPLPRIRRVD
jgi:hypothetical protein